MTASTATQLADTRKNPRAAATAQGSLNYQQNGKGMLTHELTTDNARAEALADVLRDAPRVDQTSRAEVLAWAAQLQARGVHLFAVARRGKEPATPGGFRDATTAPEALAGQYADGMNLGAHLGPSGLVVIDADTGAEVAEFRALWEAGWFGGGPSRPFPEPTVTTPGTGDGHADGGHWWFAASSEHTAGMPSPEVGCGTYGANATAMTGDRYVLLPGSVRDDVADRDHPAYRTAGTVAPAPASLVNMVARAESARKRRAAEAAERRAAFQDRRAAGDAGDFETSVEDWEAATSWAELLEPHGWTVASSVASCGCENWTRPGKGGGAKSATAHVACETVGGSTLLQVFSDHADPLKAKAHSKLQTYTALEHGGDMSAAVAELGLATSVEGHGPVMLSAEDVRATVVSPATEAWWAETVAKVEARAAARATTPGAWELEDLSDVLDGTYTPPETGLARRTDGVGLFYPGCIHDVHARPGTGKSLFAQWATTEVLAGGGHVLYLDYESSRAAVAHRLVSMGAQPEAMRRRLGYKRPPGHVNQDPDGFLAMLESRPWDLVVVDGVNRALALAGCGADSQDDVNAWIEAVPEAIVAATGAAVLMVDHLPKGRDAEITMPIGAQAKYAAITGVSFALVPGREPLGRGQRGTLNLVSTKDREGQLDLHGTVRDDGNRFVGTMVVDSDSEGAMAITVEPPAEAETAQSAEPAKAGSQALGVLDVFLGSVETDGPALTQAEVVHVIVAALGGDDGLTETELRRMWQDVAPSTFPTKPAHVKRARERALERGYIRRTGRGQHRVRVGETPDKVLVSRAVEALERALDGVPDNTA